MHKYVCLHICMLTVRVPDNYRDQKRLSGSPELGLQIAVSHNEDTETQNWGLLQEQ